MSKKLMLTIAALGLLLVGGTAYAQAVADPSADPVGFFGFLYQKLTAGQYVVAFGGGLVGLVWVLRSVMLKRVAWLSTKLGGWVVSFGTAGLMAVGTALMAGQAVSVGLLGSAFTAALAASGGYEALRDLIGLGKSA